MKTHWLSRGLLVLAYATFGQFIHASGLASALWLLTCVFLVAKAGVLTLFWRPVQTFVLQGFKTDVGYSVMVLVLASLAVLAVVQVKSFAYIVVLVAAALLVKVDCLLEGLGDRRSFVVLILLPLLGLGLSWLPALLFQGAELAV